MVLGLDPGSLVTGYGVVQFVRGQTIHIDSGAIVCQRQSMSMRLAAIYDALCSVLAEVSVDVAVIEQVFVSKNPSVALKLGQVRGVIMLACAKQSIEMAEYAPRKVKQTLVGFGGATKAQIQFMVK